MPGNKQRHTTIVTPKPCYSRGAALGKSGGKPFHVTWYRKDTSNSRFLWFAVTVSPNLSDSDISAEDGRLVGEGGEDRRQFSKAVGLCQDSVELVGAVLRHDGVVGVSA